MKKLAAILLIFGVPMALANTIEEQVKQSLEMWEPNEIRIHGESLTVISKERQITDKIYRAMILGLCGGTISRPNSLNGVSEIKVLNQFGRQGYVFEGGIDECKKIIHMPVHQTKFYVLERTHMHSNQ